MNCSLFVASHIYFGSAVQIIISSPAINDCAQMCEVTTSEEVLREGGGLGKTLGIVCG